MTRLNLYRNLALPASDPVSSSARLVVCDRGDILPPSDAQPDVLSSWPPLAHHSHSHQPVGVQDKLLSLHQSLETAFLHITLF